MSSHSSKFQTNIVEKAIVKSLKARSTQDLKENLKFEISSGRNIHPDLATESFDIVYEIYSRYEKLNSGSKRKIHSDILKMLLIEKLMGKPIEKHIVIVSENVGKYLVGENWLAKAIEEFNIIVDFAKLSNDIEVKLSEVSKEQARKFKG